MLFDKFDEIVNFIFSDVRKKNETKELAVLVRITCIIFAIYYLIIGIIISFYQHYFLGLSMILAIAFVTAAFMFTYEDHTSTGLILLNLVIIIFSTLLALNIGYDLDFHFPIFITVLLIYFNKSKHMYLKRFFTIGLCIYMMIFAQIFEALGSKHIAAGFPTILIRSVNMILITSAIGTLAYCYCNKFNQAEEKLMAINKEYETLANYDALTKLANRRHMNECLQNLESEFNRTGKGFCIAIGDVDFFKKVNDTYGHDTGDYVLSTLAGMFSEHMKNKGIVARWGGEEFLFAFENSDRNQAYLALDELRHKIEITPFHYKEYDFKVSMTYGLEEYNDRLGIEITINKADQKLYEGKTSGRNKVVF